MSKKIATRQMALNRLTVILDHIRRLDNKALFSNDSVYQAAYDRGKEVYRLAVKWELKRDLAQSQERDFVLLHAPFDWLPPGNPRKLFELAVYFGHWSLAEHHKGMLQQEDFSLVLRGVARNSTAEGISFILRNFTEVDQCEAKLVLSLGFTRQLYPLIRHLDRLYELAIWYTSQLDGAVNDLIKTGYPADTDALVMYFSQSLASIENVRAMMRLGAEVTGRVREAARRYFRQWWLLSDTQILEMFALYGVDPATLDDNHRAGTFDRQIRHWLKLVSTKGSCWTIRPTANSLYLCMVRIAEVEPEMLRYIPK